MHDLIWHALGTMVLSYFISSLTVYHLSESFEKQVMSCWGSHSATFWSNLALKAVLLMFVIEHRTGNLRCTEFISVLLHSVYYYNFTVTVSFYTLAMHMTTELFATPLSHQSSLQLSFLFSFCSPTLSFALISSPVFSFYFSNGKISVNFNIAYKR